MTLYRGMTPQQLLEMYDDTLCIPDFYALLQQNREKAAVIRKKLNPFSDIAYGNAPVQKLDIYAPENARNLPVLIDIHGGGWMAGSKNARSIPAEVILKEHVIWITIDYGLAPEYCISDIIAQARTALAWVYKNVMAYGGNPEKLYISGQSAGAHLAATTLMPAWHEAYEVPEDVIKGFIGISGIYDLAGLIHSPVTEIQTVLKLTKQEARCVSPLYHPPRQKIPSILVYGEAEPLAYKRETMDYAEMLREAGCPVSQFSQSDANHFDTINVLADKNSPLFQAMMTMIQQK